MDTTSLNQKLTLCRDAIAEACRSARRDPTSVTLVAVSKLHDLDKVQEAFALGQRIFGENYVQEAVDKVERWSPPELEWHFIGRIQTNKVKAIVNRFACIHSVERLEVAERLDRATITKQNIFIQFNVANESSKGGAGADEVGELVRAVSETCPKLQIMGLMVMPPLSDDPETTRPFFRMARELLERLKAELPGQPLDQLSMGTSGDFEVAIAEGATHVRIGTEIFGPRPPRS